MIAEQLCNKAVTIIFQPLEHGRLWIKVVIWQPPPPPPNMKTKVRKTKTYFLFYIGARKKQYARRGPTYDEESLKSTDVVPPPSNTPSAFPTGLPAIGRGRGRGREIPTQPLRRPAIPGIAGGEEHRKVESQPSSSQDESPWSGTLGAGRGRGVRPPNTAPMGWAGPISAPDPSAAPLPPSAWQQGRLPTANMNIAGMPSLDWPSLGASSNQASTNLHNDFQSFSLFDKDEYDY